MYNTPSTVSEPIQHVLVREVYKEIGRLKLRCLFCERKSWVAKPLLTIHLNGVLLYDLEQFSCVAGERTVHPKCKLRFTAHRGMTGDVSDAVLERNKIRLVGGATSEDFIFQRCASKKPTLDFSKRIEVGDDNACTDRVSFRTEFPKKNAPPDRDLLLRPPDAQIRSEERIE